MKTSRAARFLKELPRMVLPLLIVVAAIAVALRLLNLVPAHIKAQTAVKEYATVEQVEAALGTRVILPAYFPDYLSWPAYRITVQRRPALDIWLHFLSRDGSREALSIRQIVWPEGTPPVAIAEPDEVLQRTSIEVDSARGTLLVGQAADGSNLNQLRWRQGDRYIVVTTVHSLAELLRIASSMSR
ncbi:MAG: hypothetical protein V1724_09710 [Chloroflexota bacterium]